MTGRVRLGHLDIGPLLKSDAHRSDITGTARLDLRFDARGGPLGPIRGRVDLDASQARYAQYVTSQLHAAAVIEPSQIRIDARGQAYGGPIASAGTIVPGRAGRPTRFDLKGNVRDVDLRALPRHLGVPPAATDITGAYHLAGTARRFQVRGTLEESTVAAAAFFPGTLVSFTRDGSDISYAAEGRTSGLDLRRFGRSFGVAALDAEMYESNIAGDFRVSGAGTRLDTLAIDASGTIGDSEVLGATVPQLTFISSLHDRDLEVQAKGGFSGFNPAILRATVGEGANRIPGGQLTGTLDVNLGIRDLGAPAVPLKPHKVRLKADSTSLATRPRLVESGLSRTALTSRPGLVESGFLTAEASAEAVSRTSSLIDRLELDGTITLTKSRVEQLAIDAAAFTGSYRDRAGELKIFELKSPSVQVTASGPLALNETGRSDLQYSLDTRDTAALGSMAGLPIAGALQTSGRLTGNASELTATGQVKGSDVRYDDYRAGTLDSRYELRLPELSRNRLAVRADTHATAVTVGNTTISDVKAVTSYAEKRLDFEADVIETGRQVQSTGSLTLHPDHREVHFNAFSIASGDVRWMLAPEARPAVRYGRDRLEIDRLALVGPGGDQRLSVDGGFGPGQPGLEIEATNVDLAPIDTILLLKRQLQGRLTTSARLTGTRAEPFIEGRFALENGGIGGYTFQSARADVDQQGDVLLVDGVIDQMPGAGLTVKGRLPLALFSEKARRAPAGEHVVSAPQMDLHVLSQKMDLAMLGAFTHRLSNTMGAAMLDVHVRGTLRDPHFEGFLELTDAAFTLVPTAVPYHGIQVRLNFEPDLVRISRFEIVDDHNHRLRMSGELAVHERTVGNLNLLVEGQSFEVIDNQLADIELDTLLQIGGDVRNPRLRGQVELTDGSLNVDEVLRIVRRPAAFQPPPDPFDFSTLPEAVAISRPVPPQSVTPSTPGQVVVPTPRVSPPAAAVRPDEPAPPPLTAAAFFKNLEADLRFTMPNNLTLRGTDLQADETALIGFGEIQAMVGGDLSIRKAPRGKPRIIGTINTVRGTYAFQGRRFQILRDGDIRFVGLEEIDPFLNITAQREISGVVAQVHIGGTLRTPELTLSSRPPLDQTDILSLIAFNQPANELGAGQRPSLAERAAAFGTGFAAGRLTRELGRALELDLLDIQPPSDLEGGGASVTVGQRIGRSTFLRVTQRFGPASSTEVGVEQQLTDFLRLDATGAQGLAVTRQIFRRVERAGIDLVFFFSY